jgi:hypothetical protein
MPPLARLQRVHRGRIGIAEHGVTGREAIRAAETNTAMSNTHPFDFDRFRRHADAIGLRYGWPSDEDRAARPHVVRLPVSRARLGDWRFARMLNAARVIALRLDPDCVIEAIYEDRERTGYAFAFATAIEAARLGLCYERLLAGRPVGLGTATT